MHFEPSHRRCIVHMRRVHQHSMQRVHAIQLEPDPFTSKKVGQTVIEPTSGHSKNSLFTCESLHPFHFTSFSAHIFHRSSAKLHLLGQWTEGDTLSILLNAPTDCNFSPVLISCTPRAFLSFALSPPISTMALLHPLARSFR